MIHIKCTQQLKFKKTCFLQIRDKSLLAKFYEIFNLNLCKLHYILYYIININHCSLNNLFSITLFKITLLIYRLSRRLKTKQEKLKTIFKI